MRRRRERPTEPHPIYGHGLAVSQVRELEPETPSVRNRITEVPETSRSSLNDPDFETIPAPAWIDADDES